MVLGINAKANMTMGWRRPTSSDVDNNEDNDNGHILACFTITLDFFSSFYIYFKYTHWNFSFF